MKIPGTEVRWLVVALSGLVWWGACRSAPEPAEAERLFAEAETLRARYERAASQEAIERYLLALDIWEELGHRRQAGLAAQRAGDVQMQLGAVAAAGRSYARALPLVAASDDRLLESAVRSDLGLVLGLQGAYDRALEHCRRALALAETSGGVHEQAEALGCLGELDYYRGQFDDARTSYQRAEMLSRSVPAGQALAEAQLLLGAVLIDLGEFEDAERYLDHALSFWEEQRDTRRRARTLSERGRLQHRMGEYQRALNDFNAALRLFEPAGNALGLAVVYMGIAHVYYDTARGRDALEYLARASEYYETSGLDMAAVDALMAHGLTYLGLEEPGNAIPRFAKALALSERSGNRYYQAYALRYLGQSQLALDRPAEALSYLERSLRMQETGEEELRLQADTLRNVAEAHELLEDLDSAMENFERSVELSRRSGHRVAEAAGLFGLARVARARDDLETARTRVEAALDVTESLRTEVESRELRASYFASVYDYHELHIDVLMRLHRTRPAEGFSAAAFEASERARARSLLESLTEARVDLRKGADPALLERERQLKTALDEAAQRQLRLSVEAGAAEEAAHLAARIRDLDNQYDQVQSEIRSRNPRYAALTRPRPLRLPEIQRDVLDDGTLLLEYALGEERSFLWVVWKTGEASFELAARSEIERRTRRVHELLTERLRVTGSLRDRQRLIALADERYWVEAAHLSQMLLGPVSQLIRGKRLLVVSDGALLHLPFGALPAPGNQNAPKPLIVDHEIVSLPSASALAVLRRETGDRPLPPRTVVVLADPVFEIDDPRLRRATSSSDPGEVEPPGTTVVPDVDGAVSVTLREAGVLRDGMLRIPRLASTRGEARAIVAAAPGGKAATLLDFEASRIAAMGPELAEYRIVHFATHGVFNNDHPGLSGVVLSMFDEQGRAQDGFLRLDDIYNLHLPAELVALSACSTALGEQLRGEGLIGIVSGFMYAGSKRVLASLWKVDDEATAELMTRFYDRMLNDGLSAPAALRQAQVSLWQEEQWREPYYWAAFVLQGEWR